MDVSGEAVVGGTAGRAHAASGIVLLTLASAQFLMTLDSSVMNVSIATVAKDVGTTVTGIQTAITFYALVMASLMITGGKLGQILGRKRAFAIGCVIYGCGSLTTAFAGNLAVLIAGWSVLEGAGAALILPAIVALVASNFARDQRPRAYGLVASAGAIAVAAGPLIGGLVTTYLSWRWVFVGEVLIVLIILGLARRMADTPAEEGARLDVVGTVLSALGLGLVVYGILRSGTWGFVLPKPSQPAWLGLSPVIWLILAGGVVLVLFFWWENHRLARGRAVLLDPALLRNPDAARRARGVLLPVLPASGPVLRCAVVPVGGARAVRDRDRRPAAAAVPHAAAGCRGRSPGLPARLPAPRRPDRIPLPVRWHRGHAGRARRGRRAGDRDLADAARGSRGRRAGLATRGGDRVLGARQQSGEVGGVQNTVTNLGASIGTALAGAVLISALTASFLSGVQNNPAVPKDLASTAQVQLAGGVPFMSDQDLKTQLDKAGVPPQAADAIVQENATARIDGLRASLSVLAVMALLAVPFSRRIPVRQPSAQPVSEPAD